MTREEILAVYEQGPEAVVALVESLLSRLSSHEARLQALESHLRQDSHNSSKPPATDVRRRRPRSLRTASGRPSGGQRGHPGQHLPPLSQPDHTVIHRPAHCAQCHASLPADAPVGGTQHRQVFDLPPLQLTVTEHRALTLACPACGHRTAARFPVGVTAPTQYGPHLLALATYLREYQLLPLARTRQLLRDLLGQPVSEGVLLAAQRQAAHRLAPFERRVRQLLRRAPVLHLDETGGYVAGARWWLHTASTPALTLYTLSPYRGRQATERLGLLRSFAGVAVHDAYPTYFVYACAHALCNVHHLRELTFLAEEEHLAWAAGLKRLLLAMHQAVGEARVGGQHALSPSVRRAFQRRYGQLLAQGLAQHPAVPRAPGNQRRPRQSKARNLLERLRDRRDAVLRFLTNFAVPFDNNLAERDLRMLKVQQKVAGCFRTAGGGTRFCRIRSYLSTVVKQGISAYQALQQLFQGQPFLPDAPT
jgi:transposase